MAISFLWHKDQKQNLPSSSKIILKLTTKGHQYTLQCNRLRLEAIIKYWIKVSFWILYDILTKMTTQWKNN